MIRASRATASVALALAIVAAAQAVAAQANKPAPSSQAAKSEGSRQGSKPAAADARDVNLRAYVELLRSDVRSQKVAILTEMMNFNEQEDATFWPIYREYDAELSKINDDRVTLIQEYAKNYEEMTDTVADRTRPWCARPRSAATRAEAKVRRPPRVGVVAENGRAVPSSGKPAPHDHRPADFRGAARRQVTRPVNGRRRDQASFRRLDRRRQQEHHELESGSRETAERS